jgi:hypothetical protein
MTDTSADGHFKFNCNYVNVQNDGENLSVQSTVTCIKEDSFGNCNSMKTIHIPNSLTKIGNEDFYFCESLTTINIPNSVTKIGNKALNRINQHPQLNDKNSLLCFQQMLFFGTKANQQSQLPY